MLIKKIMTNDNRINLIPIPYGLKDALNNAGFTVESILNNEPSKIAQDLGIEEYVGKIIFEETKKEFTAKKVAEIVNP